MLDLQYKVKARLWWYLSSSISVLVGIFIVPFLYIIPVIGSTGSKLSSISSGLEKRYIISICILWVSLFLLFLIKLYNVLHMLSILGSIFIAFSFLALNLKAFAIPLWALLIYQFQQTMVLYYFLFLLIILNFVAFYLLLILCSKFWCRIFIL